MNNNERIKEAEKHWKEETLNKALQRFPERKKSFEICQKKSDLTKIPASTE